MCCECMYQLFAKYNHRSTCTAAFVIAARVSHAVMTIQPLSLRTVQRLPHTWQHIIQKECSINLATVALCYAAQYAMCTAYVSVFVCRSWSARVCVCGPDVSSWLVYLMLAPQTVIKPSSPGLEG